MKTIKTLSYFLFATLFTIISNPISAQVNTDVDGIIRVSSSTPRIELFDHDFNENRVEGWIEETGDRIYLTSLYDDLVFSAANTGTEVERMRILAENGHVGINILTSLNSLHIKQISANNGIRIENEANTNYWTTYTDAVNDYNFGYNGALRAYIHDGSGSFVITSDQRLKNSVERIETILDKVMKLKPAQYYYNNDRGHDRKAWGFLAQEVEAVFPEIIMEKNGYKGLVYDDFAIMSIKAIQEQQDIIDSQSIEITNLQNQLKSILIRMTTLENNAH